MYVSALLHHFYGQQYLLLQVKIWQQNWMRPESHILLFYIIILHHYNNKNNNISGYCARLLLCTLRDENVCHFIQSSVVYCGLFPRHALEKWELSNIQHVQSSNTKRKQCNIYLIICFCKLNFFFIWYFDHSWVSRNEFHGLFWPDYTFHHELLPLYLVLHDHMWSPRCGRAKESQQFAGLTVE